MSFVLVEIGGIGNIKTVINTIFVLNSGDICHLYTIIIKLFQHQLSSLQSLKNTFGQIAVIIKYMKTIFLKNIKLSILDIINDNKINLMTWHYSQ